MLKMRTIVIDDPVAWATQADDCSYSFDRWRHFNAAVATLLYSHIFAQNLRYGCSEMVVGLFHWNAIAENVWLNDTTMWCQGHQGQSERSAAIKCPLCKYRTWLGPSSVQGLPLNSTAIKHSSQKSGLHGGYDLKPYDLKAPCASRGAYLRAGLYPWHPFLRLKPSLGHSEATLKAWR